MDEKISGTLREGTNEVDASVARIYGETNQRLGLLARHQVVAQLKEREEDGRAVAVGQGATYRPV